MSRGPRRQAERDPSGDKGEKEKPFHPTIRVHGMASWTSAACRKSRAVDSTREPTFPPESWAEARSVQIAPGGARKPSGSRRPRAGAVGRWSWLSDARGPALDVVRDTVNRGERLAPQPAGHRDGVSLLA